MTRPTYADWRDTPQYANGMEILIKLILRLGKDSREKTTASAGEGVSDGND